MAVPEPNAPAEVVDPVCGMAISPADAVGHVEHNGHTYYFCAGNCLEQFSADPERFLTPIGARPPATPAAATEAHVAGRISWAQHRALRREAFIWAVSGGVGLVTVYVGVLALANSTEHVLGEFRRLWYWMVPLIAGFAVQLGLFGYSRAAARGGTTAHAHGVVASGGASTVSMVACCAHHLTDVLPLVGLAGAALVLTTYQTLFLLLGLLSNVVGVVYMLGLLHRHGLFPEQGGFLSRTVRGPVERAFLPVATASVVIFLIAIVWTVI